MMDRRISISSTGLLLCALLLVSGVAPGPSRAVGSPAPDTRVQETASGGRYRLVGTGPGLPSPAGLCSVGPGSASAVQGSPADAARVSAWATARGEPWQARGAASGGGYRLTGLTGDQWQGRTWQVRGGASGGSYSLQAPAAPASHIGSCCCCTYLPGITRP